MIDKLVDRFIHWNSKRTNESSFDENDLIDRLENHVGDLLLERRQMNNDVSFYSTRKKNQY